MFTVELNAKYIKGMIRNPNIHPNATVNRWITGILLFNFKLQHVPGERHAGPDRLSQCSKTLADEGDVDKMPK
jgi:hypothetical protein